MDDVILRGIGFWLITIIEAFVVFLAFMLGKWTNGLAPELAIFIGTMLAASQVLVFLIIKKYFKIEE